MLQIQFAVQIAFNLRSRDAHLEVMPLAGRCRSVADPLHRGALAFLEFPKNEIVLKRICSDRQIVAIGLEVEEDSGALIDATGNSFETHGELAVLEVANFFRDGIREIRIGLNAIEKFSVSV